MTDAQIRQRLDSMQREIDRLKARDSGNRSENEWRSIAGSFANDPLFEKAMRYGASYRKSLRPQIVRPAKKTAMIILDTDVVSLVQRTPSAVAEQILARIDAERKTQPVVTTVITYEEQIRGWFRLLAEARTMKDQIEAYRRLVIHADNYRRLTLIEFNDAAAVEFQRLKGLKIRIGTMDLRIAAIALAQHATLWSRNLRDFKQVPKLQVEDPTV